MPPEVEPEKIKVCFYKPISVSLIQLGQYNESRDDPDPKASHGLLSAVAECSSREASPPDTVTELVQSFSMNPDVNFHADALLAMGRTDKAIANFEACAQKCDEMAQQFLEPNMPLWMGLDNCLEARRNLGRALQATSRFAEAAKELETSLVLFTQWTSAPP